MKTLMKTLLFVSVIIIFLAFGLFLLYRAETATLEATFSLNVFVPEQGSPNDAFGYLNSNNVNFSISRYPNTYAKNAFNFAPDYPENATGELVNFQIMLNLNGSKTVIQVPNFKNYGSYSGAISCYLNGLGSGNYILSISLLVNGVTEEKPIQSIITIP